MPTKPTAHEVLDATMEDHAWKAEPLTLDSTDGIRRTLQAQGRAIGCCPYLRLRVLI